MRRVLLALLVVVLAVVVLDPLRRPLLAAVGRFLIVQDRLERADVIIVLSGGRGDERVRQAAELYQQGYAPLVLLSGGEETAGISVPEILRRQALALGIPLDALLTEPDSTSTAEQARFLRPLLEPRGIRRAIIVTSSYHTRRTRRLFRRAFAGSGIDLRVYPVQRDVFNPDGWWTREQDTETLVIEYIKLAISVVR
jgi:uncharacterized SAM-binding protein YcdF (DUF218 family)